MTCPNCQHPDRQVRYRLSTYSVVVCRRCGIGYNGDFPEPERLGQVFSEHYYREVQREAFEHIRNPARQDASRDIYELGLDLACGAEPPGRLLDVGCAFGAFMQLALARGWSVAGVEISPYSSQYAREHLHLDVFTGDLSSAPFSPGSFDLITFWDVIEHVRDVRSSLERAHQLLRPGGRLLLTTDNFDGLIGRLAGLIYRLTLGSVRYPVERFYIPYNSCYLTSRDVRVLLESAQFEVTALRGIDYPAEKINLSRAEAVVLRALYAAGRWTGLTSQVLAAARRR